MKDETVVYFWIGSGCTTLILATILAAALLMKRSKKQKETKVVEEPEESLDPNVYPGGLLTVYFGSQTGTAESFASQIQREGPKHGFKVKTQDLEDVMTEEDYDPRNVMMKKHSGDDTNKAIFLMATYGEGEPTDNATEFIRFIHHKTGIHMTKLTREEEGEENTTEQQDIATYFAGMEYMVFGLGNRQYEFFNNIGKFTDKTLHVMGATRIAALGLGNDDDDLDGDFATWKDSVLWPTLKQRYLADVDKLLTAAQGNDDDAPPECPFLVQYVSPKKNVVAPNDMQSSQRHYVTAQACPVLVKRELRSRQDDGGSTIHVELDIRNTTLQYTTADNLGVLPINDDTIVEAVAKALGFDLDAWIEIKPRDDDKEWHGLPIPTPCSVRECLANYCDVTGPLRRSDLKLLSYYAKDGLDKKALLRMSSKEGKAEFKEKIVEPRVGMANLVTKLCTSIRLPLADFLAACPRLTPRYYTISSSSIVYPESIHVTVSITKMERGDGTIFEGVCSNYLAKLKKHDTVKVFVRPSSFRLPQEPSTPIIMIGPGTGVAPMRAFLQERQYQKVKSKLTVGANILYFGCKKRTHDYIYRDEMNQYVKKGILSKLYLAFSREHNNDNNKNKKVYVQHLLLQEAKETWKWIEQQNAHVYVCGGVKMGHDVSETLKEIFVTEGKVHNAGDYLEKLQSSGRYVQELWA